LLLPSEIQKRTSASRGVRFNDVNPLRMLWSAGAP
jgi:hypothetical protein